MDIYKAVIDAVNKQLNDDIRAAKDSRTLERQHTWAYRVWSNMSWHRLVYCIQGKFVIVWHMMDEEDLYVKDATPQEFVLLENLRRAIMQAAHLAEDLLACHKQLNTSLTKQVTLSQDLEDFQTQLELKHSMHLEAMNDADTDAHPITSPEDTRQRTLWFSWDIYPERTGRYEVKLDNGNVMMWQYDEIAGWMPINLALLDHAVAWRGLMEPTH